MKIIFLSSKKNWIYNKIDVIINKITKSNHYVKKINHHKKISKSDILFIIGYHKIVPTKYLNIAKINLVIHESNLPNGKGWSPITWSILNNKKKLYFTLFIANNKIDSGDIVLQSIIKLNGIELFNDIKQIQFNETKKLCLKFISGYPKILDKRKVQIGKSTYFKKRAPSDSKISTRKRISEIFNLLRVSDYKNYPVYFIYRGKKFKLKLDKHD